MFERIYDHFAQVAATSSRNEKELLLKQLIGSEIEDMVKTIMYLTYSPMHNFYMNDITSLPKAGETTILSDKRPEFILSNMINQLNESKELSVFKYLDILKSREITGTAAKQFLSNLINSLSEKEADLIKRIITRDLRIGVNTSTINKVFKNLIEDIPYMRCGILNQKTLANINFPAISQLKEDGEFINIIVTYDSVTYISRYGKPIKFDLSMYDEQLITFCHNRVLMGEMLVVNDDAVMSRASGNGYLNSDSVDPSRVKIVLWDVVPINVFKGDAKSMTYSERLDVLQAMIPLLPDAFKLVETRYVSSFDEMINHFKYVRSKGLEGVIIKDYNNVWKDGTSKTQLKVKVDAVADLVIVGFNYGKGKYKNMIGSISCESADGSIQVDVSGFADDFRRFAVELIDGWIDKGQVMEVKFNDIVQNANTQVKSLFLPRFVRLSEKVGRESADTLERIEDILAEFSLPLADK